jgi:hypothetical protein
MGQRRTAITAHQVTDGVDRCRLGILGREFVNDSDKNDGKMV